MTSSPDAPTRPRIALDVMGGDQGPEASIGGVKEALAQGLSADITLFGREDEVRAQLSANGLDAADFRLVHTEDVITMDDKPTLALRRGKKSSMFGAISALKSKDVDAVVSCGNTGALMAMSTVLLRMIEGIDRPAITAVWPTPRGRTVVLDVGAGVEADARQLVQFAIMGEAYFRALTEKERPTVGLLNVGSEEQKGHETIRLAATILREADAEMAFKGFVEGNGISQGDVDVVVTDGFTGNIALKTAEGTARLVGSWLKEALISSTRAKLGAALAMPALNQLKEQMNPSRVNGAPLLGLNGLVIKSHGGADAIGIASALKVAQTLAEHPFQDEIRRTVSKVERRAEAKQITEDSPQTAAAE